MLFKKIKIIVFKIFEYFEKFKDFFFILSLFCFLFFRLNYLLKLNINFLIIFFIVLIISFIIFKKIEILSKFLKNNNILNYIFYNFILFKEYMYELIFEEFNFSFKEKLLVFYTLFNLGALISMILYKSINYVLFNIIFFFFFFSYKILTMFEGFIIKKYFVEDDLISYENIKIKLNINNNLKFPQEKRNLINVHKRFFVLPIMTPAGLTLKNLLKEKVTSVGAGLGAGTIAFYAYDSYHKKADRNIANENLKVAIENRDIADKKAKEEIYIAKYHHLKKEKSEAEKLYADCLDNNSWSFFNSIKNKEALSKKNIEEATLAIENIKKDAAKDNIKLYSVIESSFFN